MGMKVRVGASHARVCNVVVAFGTSKLAHSVYGHGQVAMLSDWAHLRR